MTGLDPRVPDPLRPADTDRERWVDDELLYRRQGCAVLACITIAAWVLIAILGASVIWGLPWVLDRVTYVPSADAATPFTWTAQPAEVFRPVPTDTPTAAPRPARTERPTEKPARTPRPSVRPARAIGGSIAGVATHYTYRVGQAAAAYRLKKLLGPDWRGRLVRVCVRGYASSGCLVLRLTDSMGTHDRAKVIDLDDRDFGTLATAAGVTFGTGVLRVSVREVRQ